MKGCPRPQEPNAAGRSILPSNNSFHPDPHRLRRIGLVKLNVRRRIPFVVDTSQLRILLIIGWAALVLRSIAMVGLPEPAEGTLVAAFLMRD